MAHTDSTCQDSGTDYATATRQQLLAEIDYWKNRAQHAEDKAAEVAAQLYLYEGWIANPELQGSLPSVLIGTHLAIAKARAQGAAQKDGKTHVYRADVAKFSGCSESTVSDGWKKLSENALLSKDIVGEQVDGVITKNCYVEIPKQVLLRPQKVALQSKTKKLGGARVPTCKDCGSPALLRQVRYTCQNCGSTMAEKDAIMMAEEEVATLTILQPGEILLADGSLLL